MTTDESLKLMETLGAAFGELLNDLEGMKMKREIEIELPEEIASIWEPVRFGVPVEGESFVDYNGLVIKADGDRTQPRLVVKRKRWEPKDGEAFWYVAARGEVCGDKFLSHSIVDMAMLKVGNCYRTREEANQAAERVRKAYKGDE